jgi:hypothetical protein
MFAYALAGQSEAVQRWYQQELQRFVEWMWQWEDGQTVTEAVEVVEGAVCQCAALSWQQYHHVCGAAALLAYVAREAHEAGFERLRVFFQQVPNLFQIDWSCRQEPASLVEVGGDGWQ